ncbi:MAG: acyl-CoA thioesterase [Pirellulales bacterium]|nr:acyl-CoA thioesterase [Pirellulales bacterium]
MSPPQSTVYFRVLYADTDQMQTYYNARVLEWFERGRNELLRELGKAYRLWEESGIMLPVREVWVRFEGRAEYDDRLKLDTSVSMPSKAQIRFDCRIEQADSGQAVCHGHTVHAIVSEMGRPVRPPGWLVELIAG